ncbi:MAG: FdtA/QdtA family cupin domain-containing protein [Bacteroidales bacterium]
MRNVENKQMRCSDCHLITLPQIHNRAGNLTSVNNGSEIPFDIRRVYYLYDVPAGAERGGHSHLELQSLLVAASGSFDVIIDDGHTRKTIRLDRPNIGLLIAPGIWREIVNFSGGSICMVLASEKYDESDYVRDYEEFRALKNECSTL